MTPRSSCVRPCRAADWRAEVIAMMLEPGKKGGGARQAEWQFFVLIGLLFAFLVWTAMTGNVRLSYYIVKAIEGFGAIVALFELVRRAWRYR